jgi:hypothetical protein
MLFAGAACLSFLDMGAKKMGEIISLSKWKNFKKGYFENNK